MDFLCPKTVRQKLFELLYHIFTFHINKIIYINRITLSDPEFFIMIQVLKDILHKL